MKANNDGITTKADRREKKRKPKMAVHGRNLKKQSPFGGFLAAGKRKK